MLAQHTRQHVTFKRLQVQVSEMLRQKAWLHYYLQEGLEEDFFVQAIEQVRGTAEKFEEYEKSD